MTATAIMFTSLGFAVSADGRQRWGHKATRDEAVRREETETAQKIFPIKARHIMLACILRGHVSSRDKSFSLEQELKRQSLICGGGNCLEFVKRIAARLESAIEHAKSSGRIKDYPATELSFVGYRNNDPCWIDVQFHPYRNRIGSFYEMTPQQLYPGFGFVSGSLVIRDLITNGDPRVGNFVKPIDHEPTLSDAIDFTRGYVQACASLGLQLDPTNCQGIGGHIHVASVAPSNSSWFAKWIKRSKDSHQQPTGFQWIIPPL